MKIYVLKVRILNECRKNDKESLYFRLIHVNRNLHEFRSSHQSHVLVSVNIRQIFVRKCSYLISVLYLCIISALCISERGLGPFWRVRHFGSLNVELISVK